ncbi:DNA-directed RNA polymerase I subunit rpa49 [Golovinomyces cichoracearum]|uniref:DNA-directed RNA polymerase I subunit rpa49 n=1 Tax=Golovinomyces cichoracearum TaxID=62708 RepID=A0A420I9T0_9PEZI|nr:DNA-directed RNA polymerase I subunit rpa49 [Golovinomyces cichoracearum]
MTEYTQDTKKRKRSSHQKSQARKRVAIELDPQIKIVSHEEEQWVPVIASVPGINVDDQVLFKSYLKDRSNESERKPSILAHELLLLSSDHPKINYRAKEEEEGGPNALRKHYVGIYDPATGNLDLMEARNTVLRGIVRTHQHEEEDVTTFNNIREQRNILGQTFGTKKARKAIASITENAILPMSSQRDSIELSKVSPATAVVLSNVAEATKDMKSRDDLAKDADDVKPRPRAIENATNIEDVYTVESLIGTDILMLVPIKEWQDKAKEHKEIFVSSKFVANRIQKNANDVKKLRILRFMLMLLEIYFKSRQSKEGRRLPKADDVKDIIGDIPEVVLGAAKRKFVENGIINKYHADLLITHLCAMSLIVDDFQTDTYDLKEDLQLDLSQITRYYSEIGAKSYKLGKTEVERYGKVVASQRRLAKLKLPLVLPKLSFGGRRR